MRWFSNREDEKAVESIRQTVTEAVVAALSGATDKVKEALKLGGQVHALKEELTTLRIDKSKKEEEFAREKREVEHMVGLERKRQEFEMEAAKRGAVLDVREENLKAERKRFEEAMSFHDKRFTEEVGYLKEMIGRVLEAIPNVGDGPKKKGR